jgi:hypothetical protein
MGGWPPQVSQGMASATLDRPVWGGRSHLMARPKNKF